ncbi:hypothetical protein [Methanolapillus ohkumae]|uniref:hypothetical protein n=1 Tax=Methanolapillus ohkumae TaxID=3028298 RepID=UPI0030B8EB1E
MPKPAHRKNPKKRGTSQVSEQKLKKDIPVKYVSPKYTLPYLKENQKNEMKKSIIKKSKPDRRFYKYF